MLVDSHLHLNMIANNLQDRVTVVKEAIATSITHLQLVSTDFESFFSHLELQQLFPDAISLTLGFGPNSVVSGQPDEASYREIIVKNRLSAIGEIGLDYYHDYGSRKEQIDFFNRQLQLAQDFNLPVVIHTREADSDTLAVLQDFPSVKGVIHCFSSDISFGEAVIELGYFISFSGNLTFKRSEMIVEAARLLPLDRMLVETDSPFLSPVPMRGKPNIPAYLVYTAKFLAQLKNISVDEVASVTTTNFYRLFREGMKC